MPLDYGNTNRMRDAIRAMQQHAVGDKVGLVMRWNRRDDMIWTIYSEFMNQPNPNNIPPSERRRFERVQGNYQEENETFTPSQTPTAQIGCHAEEILIVNWTWFELDAVQLILARALGQAEPAPWANVPLQTERFRLQEVDLVLSKSPCHGPGGSQALRVGVNTYGTGCAMKLWRFCAEQRFENVQWRIFYAALPPEKPATRFRVVPVVGPRRQRQQVEQQNRDIQRNFDPAGQGPAIRGGGGTLHSPFGQKIGLALRGMAILNSVPNVTCEPL
jgi:hypothetical protein